MFALWPLKGTPAWFESVTKSGNLHELGTGIVTVINMNADEMI